MTTTTVSVTVLKKWLSFLMLFMLTACGGSSSSDSTDHSTPNDGNSPAQIVINDQTFNTNQAIELILYSPANRISDIQWQQIAGEQLTLLSDSHKVISVIPTSAGNYQFDVSFIENNEQKSLSATFDVANEMAVATVPNGQAVLAGNGISLRVFSSQSGLENISWRQTSGPTIALTATEKEQAALIFDAPEVSNDTVITFEVTGDSNDNQLDRKSVV